MRKFNYLLLICLLIPTFSVAETSPKVSEKASYEDGLIAFNRQDFTTAIMIWLPLAEAGNKDAQFQLGKLYMHPELKAHSSVIASYWFNLAANQGHLEAQTTLGLMYLHGDEKISQCLWSLQICKVSAETGGPIHNR